MPRIEPGGRSELGLPMWTFARIAGAVSRSNPPNLFTTLGRHRPLFRGWLGFARRMMPFGKLPRRDTELVILRVAHLRGCDYEWHHHVRLGKRAGIGPTELERVKAGPSAEGWSPRERAILRLVDDLHETDDVSDERWAEAKTHLDERGLIELVMLAAHYEMLATVIGTLQIETDR